MFVLAEDPVVVDTETHGKLVVVALKHSNGNTIKYTFQTQLAMVLFNTSATAGLRAHLNKEPLDRSTKLRMMTMIPVVSMVRVCKSAGKIPKRADACAALLKALGQRVPNTVLNARPTFEQVVEKPMRLAHELGPDDEEIVMTEEMTTFVPFAAPAPKSSKSYTLKGLDYTKTLDDQLKKYTEFRMAKVNSKRDGCAVVTSTVQNDISSTLRILGYFKHLYKGKGTDTFDEQYDLRLFARKDFGDLMGKYVEFLLGNDLSYGYMANILNSAMMVLNFVHRDEPEYQPSQRALFNMRNQCEKTSKQTRKYKDAHDEYISWEEAQEARLSAIAKYDACDEKQHPKRKARLLRDVLVIGFLTTQPPDRVGVIRKLRIYKTIKRIKGKWVIDLRSTDADAQHKTTRFYGPSVQKVSPLLEEFLNLWTEGGARAKLASTESDSDRAADAYTRLYLFPTSADSRCHASSSWTALVKAAFKRACGKAPPPSLLRACYITWLRSNAPDDVLKQAAKYMKHADETQASRTYDMEAYARQTEKAVAFTAAWCTKFAAAKAAKGKGKGKAPATEAADEPTVPVVDMSDWTPPTTTLNLPETPPRALSKVRKRAKKRFERKKEHQRDTERSKRQARRGIGNSPTAAVARFMSAVKARQAKAQRAARQAKGKGPAKQVQLDDAFETVQADDLAEGYLAILRSNDPDETLYMCEILSPPEGDALTAEVQWYMCDKSGGWKPQTKEDAKTKKQVPCTQTLDLKESALHWGSPETVLDEKHRLQAEVAVALKHNPTCLFGKSKKGKPQPTQPQDNTSETSSSTDPPRQTSSKRKRETKPDDKKTSKRQTIERV